MKPFPIVLSGFLALGAAMVSRAAGAEAEAPITAEQRDFFEKKIRPVLVEKCYDCHSEDAKKIKGGLVLDTRAGMREGGESGPAVVPGDLKESLLIEAIRYANKDFAMPPEKKGGKLPAAVIADFEKWVQMGAPDPREGKVKVTRKADPEAAKQWWAFQPVKAPAAPALKDAAWPRAALDRFVLAAQEAKGLKPVADADPRSLLRRVYFDLVGLPPSPAEVEAFAREPSQEALARTVDKLLASPQFGERWGRHWLDVARYAESSGKDFNIAFPHAWRYRDYVIGAFNADKPYDQFLREQIAGDLLPARDARQKAEQIVATGFLALGPKGLNEQNPRQFALDVADEQIDTLSQAVLGLTVACARCHDHKFDPIPQRDYYALAGIFLSTDTRYGTPVGVQNRHSSDLIELPADARPAILTKAISPEERARKAAQLEALKEEERQIFAERFGQRVGERLGLGARDATPKPQPQTQAGQARGLVVLTEIGILESQLESYDENGQPKALAMGVQDRPAPQGGFGGRFAERFGERLGGGMRAGRFGGRSAFPSITDSPLFARGDVEKPGEKVPRGMLTAFQAGPAAPIGSSSSGRRELAEWLVSPQNPLTARVMANRVWHWLFGRGVVESVDNFGTSGQKPANPALLDHLATRLVEGGWSVKKLIREIVLSRTYQLGSAYSEPDFAIDPENALNWRMSKRRLDAECLRDAMLAAGDQLDLQPPTGSLVAQAGDVPIGGPRFRGLSEESIISAGGTKRSVYLPVPRDVLPDSLAAFDFAESSLVSGARETTNVPAQALYLLNSPLVDSMAKKLAEKILAASPAGPNGGSMANLDQRIALAYGLVLSRPPTAGERQAAANFFGKFPSNWSKGDTRPAGLKDADAIKAAWTSFCRALFATAEFRYLN